MGRGDPTLNLTYFSIIGNGKARFVFYLCFKLENRNKLAADPVSSNSILHKKVYDLQD